MKKRLRLLTIQSSILHFPLLSLKSGGGTKWGRGNPGGGFPRWSHFVYGHSASWFKTQQEGHSWEGLGQDRSRDETGLDTGRQWELKRHLDIKIDV
jgi:hypothetical protein